MTGAGEGMQRTALRLSEEDLTKVFQSIPDAVCITRMDNGCFIEVNEAFLRLTGLRAEEVIGRTVPELGLWIGASGHERLIQLLREQGSVRDQELSFPVRSGEIRTGLCSVGTMELGGEPCFLVVTRDITQSQLASQALRDSEAHYRALAENSLELVCTHDLEGIMLSVNSAGAEALGYQPAEMVGRNLGEFLSPSFQRPFDGYLQRIRERGSASGMLRALRKDGEERVWVYRNALYAEDGRPPCVLGHAQDITELKRLEEALEQALQESEKRYRLLVETATVAIIAVDETGQIVLANRAVQRVFGYTPTELVGQPFTVLMPENLRDAWQSHSAASMDRLAAETVEFTGLHKSGRQIPLGISVAEYRSGDRRVFTGIIRDLTERKQRETELRELSHRLLRLQDEERRRIALELHENTAQSLAALVMNLALLSRFEGVLDPEAREALSESMALAKQCSMEVRTLSYILHPPALEELGLACALSRYARGFSKRSGIPLDLDLPQEPCRLPEDIETALFRVAQESLVNIHRHGGAAGGRIRLAHDAMKVLLEVSCTGQAARPEFQAAEKGEKDAALLGVGITGMRERARQLGGRLEIHCGSGGMTTRIILPLPRTWGMKTSTTEGGVSNGS